MLAYTTASRQDVPTTRAGWRVCQCFYDLIRKNDAQRQRQAVSPRHVLSKGGQG